ncbi:MAG TPA: amidohydrolase, partial [Rhodobacterales bacterium]|nr:amidohydrolase [Rhodobacterales bacterium]
MKIATACYPIDWMEGMGCYGDKLGGWVAEAAGQGAELLVFPEYAAMELAALEGRAVAGDLEASLRAVSARMAEV